MFFFLLRASLRNKELYSEESRRCDELPLQQYAFFLPVVFRSHVQDELVRLYLMLARGCMLLK